MILVDSSVWINHFRKSNTRLSDLLDDGDALVHSLVIGEIACGNLKNRTEILSLLHALPKTAKADDEEILSFIEHHQLSGQGIGLVDVHLLASCLLEPCFLWTDDKRLEAVARQLHIDISQS